MNYNQTFSILFWLNRLKVNSRGLAPIWVRITVAGKRAQFSVQRQIHPGSWDADKNRAKGNSTEARALNDYLLMIQAKITKHYNILLATKELVTAQDVKNSYKGIQEVKKTFLQLFTLYNQQLSERKEIGDLSDGRYKKFQTLYKKSAEFVKYKFKRSDVALMN
jgi:hypothetical protein